MTDEIQKLLELPLSVPLETKWQVEACRRLRDAELALTNIKGRMFNPSLSSEDKRRNELAYNTKDQQHSADTWRDIVAIMSQQIEHGRPLV